MRYLLALFFINTLCFSTEIVVISDLNGSYGSDKYSNAVRSSVDQILKIKPDLVLATGDMVAGQKAGLNYKRMWKAFHKNVTTPLEQSSIPFLVTPGNHDGSASRKFKNERAEFVTQWRAHKANVEFIDDSNYPIFYAFSLDNILFISLDATLVGLVSKDQKEWLKKVLEKNMHFKVKVAFGHIPIIPVAQKRENDYLNDSEFEQILKKHKLAMYLSGHHHTYYPGYKDSMYHISQACVGAGPRKLIGTNYKSEKSFTKISINDSKIEISAINAITGKLINKSSLPKYINTAKGILQREDLVIKD